MSLRPGSRFCAARICPWPSIANAHRHVMRRTINPRLLTHASIDAACPAIDHVNSEAWNKWADRGLQTHGFKAALRDPSAPLEGSDQRGRIVSRAWCPGGADHRVARVAVGRL